METTTRVCAICARENPICNYTERAKLTCTSCASKRRQQYTLRGQKKRSLTEAAQTQNDSLEACITAQSAEIESLQAVLTAFREPDAISDQLLSQLWSQPHNTAAIDQLLAVPVPPSEPHGNLACSAGPASGQPMPSVPEAEAQNCSALPAEALDPPIVLDMFEVDFLEC